MKHFIEFVLFPGALGLDITGPLEVFSTASKILEHQNSSDAAYSFVFSAVKKGAVPLSSGLEIVADVSFKDKIHSDTMIVPGGGDERNTADNKALIAYIHEKATVEKRIISVCKGSFLLAEAGILDNKEATTHWFCTDELAKNYPRVKVNADAIFTRDGNIYTSAGVTAGIDLALAIVEEDHGIDVAMEVARLLVVYYRRPGSQSQFSSPLKAQEAAGKRFAALHHWLEMNIKHDISVDAMAKFCAMSPRNFARVFKITTGMTPVEFLETIRLDRARELLSTGNEPINIIAEITGFQREERLRRAFLRRFNVTPSQYRLHFIKP